MADLIQWFGHRIKDAENGIGGFVNGAASTVNDAVNNVSRAVNQPQQRPQVRPPQVGVNAPRPTPTFRPPAPNVANRPQGFNPVAPLAGVGKNIGDFANGFGHTVGDVGNTVGHAVNDFVVKPVVDSANTVGNAYASGINYLGGELNGSHAAQQQQIMDATRQAAQNKIKAVTAPSQYVAAPSTVNQQQLLRQSQAQENIANTLKQQQAQQIADVRANNDPVKVGAASVSLLSTVAAPGMSKIAEPIAAFTRPALGNVGSRIVGNAISQAPVGAVLGASGQVQQTGSQTTLPELINAAGMGALGGAVLGGAAPEVANLAGKALKPAAVRAQNFGLKPPTKLTPEELAASTKVVQAQNNPVNPVSLTTQDMQLYRKAQSKLGQKPGTPDAHQAVVGALNAHRAFDVAVEQRRQSTLGALENSSQFAQNRLIPGGTLGKIPSQDKQFIAEQSTPINTEAVQASEKAKAVNDAPTEAMAALKQEALKYKSADEFVKSKVNNYHGTLDNEFKLDPNRHLFLTGDTDSASTYAGRRFDQAPTGKVEGFHAKDGKTLDLNDTATREKYVREAIGQNKNLKKYYDKIPESVRNDYYDTLGWVMGEYKAGRIPKSELDNYTKAQQNFKNISSKDVYANWDKIIAKAKKDGYDYITHTTEDPSAEITFPETVALNPSKSLISKQQLTDLYNQAHTQPTPKVEAPTGAPIEKTPNVKTSVDFYDATKGETYGSIYAERGGKRVGKMDVSLLDNGDIVVNNVEVDPKYRRQGIATELYKEASKQSKSGYVNPTGQTELGSVTRKSLEGKGVIKSRPQPKYEQPKPFTQDEWASVNRMPDSPQKEQLVNKMNDYDSEALYWKGDKSLERPALGKIDQTKNQPGVHDSLADNLPNQTGNKPIIPPKAEPTPQLHSSSYNQTVPQNSSNFNSDNYIKQQSKQQETARKVGENSPITKLKNDINTKIVDSFAPIEGALKQANKNGADIKIGDKNHITTQIDRAIRSDTIAGQYIKDKGLAKIIQDVPDTKAFDQYLIAKHAKDLEANGVKTGRNSANDARLVKELGPQYEQYAQQVKKYNDELLDKSVEYGLVSKETADALKVKYPNYVPANRIFGKAEGNNFKGTGGGKASLSSQSVVQKIKGSNREIESPLSSIAAKTADVISQGERNKAASILASYKDLPGNPFGLRELKSTELVGNRPTVSFLDKGKVRRFETTPEIAAAAKSLNKEQIGILGKIVRVPTRLLRLGATGINPAFALANITKDLASAALNSNHPIRSSVLNPGVLKKASVAALNHKSKSYAELVREGAGGTSFDIARDLPKQTVGAIRADKNIGSKALYTVTHPGQLLRAVEDTIGRSEEFSRALQYYGNKDAALKKGLSQADATRYGAHAARNNTINFARAGEYGAVLNSALPYLNAGIQGARTFNRSLINRPVQTITKVAVLGTLPVLTTTAWNLSDPQRKAAYEDISDYEKQGNLIIVPPNPVKDPQTGKWNVIKIPVSQEIANLNNIARDTLEAAVGSGEISIASVLGNLIGTTTSINATSGRNILGQVIPQAIKPGVEIVTNQNLFTGNDIVPKSQQNLPAPEQFGDYTSGTAKTIGALTGTSPRVLDNSIRTSLGGVGQNIINASDTMLANLGITDKKSIQGKNLADSITGRFFGASGKDTSTVIDKTFAESRDQLIKTDGYKALSQDEKAKALNRLQADISAIEYAKADASNPSSSYKPKKLTANQKNLTTGNRSVQDYLKTSSGSGITIADNISKNSKTILQKYSNLTEDERKADFNTNNNAEYQYNLAKYENDKANGTLTKAQELTGAKSLRKDKIGADYSKNVRDLYGVSKADLADYLATEEKGVDKKKIAQDLLAYDRALYDAGVSSSMKYKYGIAGSGKGGGKGKKGSGASLVNITKYANGIRPPKTTGSKAPSLSIRQPQLKKVANKKFNVRTAKVSGTKKQAGSKNSIA